MIAPKLMPLLSMLTCLLASFSLCEVEASPIPVQSAEKQSNGVLLRMNPGVLCVQVCTDRVIRVTYSPTSTLPKSLQTFAVIKKWTPVPFDMKDVAGAVTITTGKMAVRIDRATGAIRFLDAAGNALLQEVNDGGKSMPPATVNGEHSYRPEQSFVSPPDEVLYGLGQGQEGIWNWRGMPRQLVQHNSDIALPMLISSKGYGLLWNNAAITQVNPADDPIALDPQTHSGTFQTKDAGDYVFFVKDGDRHGEIGINVNGKDLTDIKNMWVPYATTCRVSLGASTNYTIKLLGGGGNAKIFARPLGDETTFRSDVGDAIDYYVFYGPELDDVVASFRDATGAAPLFPKWAYGFWQCREHYSSQAQLLAAAAEFRRRQIPVDLIVQDWQYWGKYGWGAYQFDAANYPTPKTMIQTLHDEHIRFMISAWSNPHGETGDALKKAGVLIPGSDYMDEFNPIARKIRWQYMNKNFFSIGTDAWWQDATEPSDDGRVMIGKPTYFGSGDRFNNAYPLYASMGTYEGQRGTSEAKRVCNLTRSAYLGQQRYGAAVWSGDVSGDWTTFRRQIAGGLNLSVTGMPYWCTDTAGFFHPDGQYTSPDYNELLVRWYQFSSFSPILRVHGGSTETEMWKWLPTTQTELLAYDKLRHRLLPYAYSVAWKVTHEGYTIMRPLVMDFRTDAKAQMISDEFMYGPAFLVAPVTTPGATSRPVYLPEGTSWVDFWTGKTFTGGQTVDTPTPLDQMPLYVRAGSIVPIGPDVQYADEKPAAPITLRVYPGADGQFTLYDDENDNYDYEKGAYATTPLTWNDHDQKLTVGDRKGHYPGMLKQRTFAARIVSPGHDTGLPASDEPGTGTPYKGAEVEVKLGANP